MIVYLLLKVMVFLYGLVISLLSTLFPIDISSLGLESVIDDFYGLFDKYSEFALNGAHFLLGDFVLGLATAVGYIYVFYYTIYIPIKFMFKIFIH